MVHCFFLFSIKKIRHYTFDSVLEKNKNKLRKNQTIPLPGLLLYLRMSL